ncbi:MAG: response regulator transcription factor [Thermaerobacter sp.]|nr:response regulator transcription factor [Thermaerobacter sp.]
MSEPTVLVVDDEAAILELVRFTLERDGYRLLVAADGWGALEIARREHPDLVILDVMLPGLTGLELCRALRAEMDLAVIMLTARKEESDRVAGLELGADDYVTKPFSPRELAARVKAVLRRSGRREDPGAAQGPVRDGLLLDAERRRVWLDGEEIELTYTEFELLKTLSGTPGRVFSREDLLMRVWGTDFLGDSRTVDVHIRHVREKLHEDTARARFIETVRGVGYRFREA